MCLNVQNKLKNITIQLIQTQYKIVQYLQYKAKHYDTIDYIMIQSEYYSTIFIIQRSTFIYLIQYSKTQCNKIQCNTIQHNTM